MDNGAPIKYRGFWDVPRIFLVPYQDKLFLFDCAFDEITEDYPDYYRVYVLPNLADEEPAGSWAKLHLKAIQYVGEVPLASVRFDPSKRREIDSTILDQLTKAICSGQHGP
jgi:hypothetical protein